MSIFVFFFGLTVPDIPEPLSGDRLSEISSGIEKKPVADTVYVLSSFSSDSQRATAVALQGLVARTSPAIFITSSALDGTYLKEIEQSGSVVSRTDENGSSWTLEKLIVKFRDCITDGGYILYREEGEGLNIATNYATLEGWLPVPVQLEQTAVNAGLVKKADISADNYSMAYISRFFTKHCSEFTGSFVIHQSTAVAGLRDFAIQQGAYVFYTDDDALTQQIFRKRVLDYFGDNAHILGWVKYEVAFVDSASEEGNMISPSDHSYNNSLLASLNVEFTPHRAEKTVYTDPTKHYVALVMSDGDNIQWVQNGYREFFTKIKLEKQFPLTWSFPPLLAELSPVTVKTVFDAAGSKDSFMSGVSGAGYMHPTQYPKAALAGFTDKTAALMLNSGLQYVQILDSTPENQLDEAKLMNCLGYYSRYDNIKGGILSLDPDRYAGGKGRLYVSDGKPFMTYRLSLWHPSGNMSEVTPAWLAEQAEIVNSYPADINSENGYSVINVHPWTVSVESLSYFVSLLDDHIVLVTVDEIMEMVQNHVIAP